MIRIYGENTEVLIDRHKEIENFRLLHKYGFAPNLLATFNNGLSYEYTDGKPLSKPDLFDKQIWRRIAQRMAEMHRTIPAKCDTDGTCTPSKSMLWTKIRSFFDLIPAKFSDPVKQKRYSFSIFLICQFLFFSHTINLAFSSLISLICLLILWRLTYSFCVIVLILSIWAIAYFTVRVLTRFLFSLSPFLFRFPNVGVKSCCHRLMKFERNSINCIWLSIKYKVQLYLLTMTYCWGIFCMIHCPNPR